MFKNQTTICLQHIKSKYNFHFINKISYNKTLVREKILKYQYKIKSFAVDFFISNKTSNLEEKLFLQAI